MKTDLARVSISLDDALLENFDAYVDDRGYSTRSEAIRDLIRESCSSSISTMMNAKRRRSQSGLEQNHPELMARLRISKARLLRSCSPRQACAGERHCLQVSILKGPRATYAGSLTRC